MPRLSLVCALGAGYENIAVAHAKARGIAVGSGAGTDDDCVADHAPASRRCRDSDGAPEDRNGWASTEPPTKKPGKP